LVIPPPDGIPRIQPRVGTIPVPHPPTYDPEDQKLDRREVRGDQVYFVLQGVLINDDSRAVRVYLPHSARFYTGPHPGNGSEIGIPMLSGAESCHVLTAGQVALFEIRVMHRIDIELERAARTDDEGHDLPFSRDQILLVPGHLDEPRLIIEITTFAEPFRERYTADEQTPLVMHAYANQQVIIKRAPVYPKSFAHLLAELRGDEQKLRSLQQAEALLRTFDKPRGKPN
jgi:hypothetical protein